MTIPASYDKKNSRKRQLTRRLMTDNSRIFYTRPTDRQIKKRLHDTYRQFNERWFHRHTWR